MTLHITWVDWLVIALYFAFVLGIGFYLKRFTKTGEDFFIAGEKTAPGSRVLRSSRPTWALSNFSE